jgi:MFS family permease
MPRRHSRRSNKWACLAASVPVALSGGLVYSFSIWSPALKLQLALDQRQLEAVGASYMLGGYSSFISGLAYDALERLHHVGPRAALAMGAATSAVGFAGMRAVVAGRLALPLPGVCLLALLAGHGGTWFDTAPLATNLRNFPAHRGTVVGLIKASVGLSAALYSTLYSGFLAPRGADGFLFLAGTAPACVALAAAPFINLVPYEQLSESDRGAAGGRGPRLSTTSRFSVALSAIAALALYLAAASIAGALHPLGGAARAAVAVGALVLLAPLAALPWGAGGLFAERATPEGEGEDSAAAPLLPPAAPGGDAVRRSTPSLSLSAALRTPELWLLAAVCAIGIGSGLAFLNNAAQLVAALGGGSSEGRAVVVSLFAVSSCFGRLLFGALPERALYMYGTPRPAFLVAAAAWTAVACAGLAAAPLCALYPLAASLGLGFGAHWSTMPALVSDLFGFESFASIYTTLQLAPALGGYVFGARLLPALYDAAARRHGGAGECAGRDCFAAAFLALASLGAGSAALAGALLARTRPLYRVEAAALRESDAAEAVAADDALL